MINKLRGICLFLGCLSGAQLLQAEKAIPYLSSPVIDDLNLLSGAEKQNLEALAQAQKELLQIQVWITGLEGESVEGLAYRAATKWALGTEKRDNGVLILVAPSERRMRIEVGRGLEGDIPDVLAGRILDLIVRPQFREGRYYQGIREAMDELVVLANKGPQADQARERLSEAPRGKKLRSPLFVFFVFGLIMLFNFISGFGRRSRFWGGGSGWSGGGGGWSSGGGSSWSGGGGSFGGGGSSSSW